MESVKLGRGWRLLWQTGRGAGKTKLRRAGGAGSRGSTLKCPWGINVQAGWVWGLWALQEWGVTGPFSCHPAPGHLDQAGMEALLSPDLLTAYFAENQEADFYELFSDF